MGFKIISVYTTVYKHIGVTTLTFQFQDHISYLLQFSELLSFVCPSLRHMLDVMVAQWLGRRTSDPAVLGSIPRPRIIRHLGQLSLPSSGVGKSSTSLHRLGLRRGVFACVGWQVTLCDPIWQATPCSSEMDSH